jgi:N-acetylglucosaminylphosphatidylinositol deacetylase
MVRKLTNAVQAVSRACHWVIATRVRRRWLIRVGLILFLFPLFLQWVLAYILGSDARLLPPELLKAKNLLIVTAHPDDECLFFSPSILGVLDRNKNIKGGLVVMSTGMSLPHEVPVQSVPCSQHSHLHNLPLSVLIFFPLWSGNNYGLGETRKTELLGSCKALGIDTSRCVALDNPDLQDNPKVWWEEAKIKPILKEYIKKWDIDAVSNLPTHLAWLAITLTRRK